MRHVALAAFAAALTLTAPASAHPGHHHPPPVVEITTPAPTPLMTSHGCCESHQLVNLKLEGGAAGAPEVGLPGRPGSMPLPERLGADLAPAIHDLDAGRAPVPAL